MKIAALAGGVGGAKLADGLARNLKPGDLTVIVNSGDDFEHFGLKICPDLDTICYTLAGMANPETGWGRVGETWKALESAAEVGAPTWFRLGDRDLGTHLERTRRLKAGQPLSRITRDFCRSWGIDHAILPMTDDPVPTKVDTDQGELPFQEYFVHQKCKPRVKGFRFEGVEKSNPAPGVLESMAEADLILICPSNPWVSIDPILNLPGVKSTLSLSAVIAVSPIIAGRAVKGPAAKMYLELGIQPSALSVAGHYGGRQRDGILSGLVIDNLDEEQASSIEELGLDVLVTDTLMKDISDRVRLAKEVLQFGKQIWGAGKA